MSTYVMTAKVFFEVEAAAQDDALVLVEEAIRRARFAVGHKMVSARCVDDNGRKVDEVDKRDRREA